MQEILDRIPKVSKKVREIDDLRGELNRVVTQLWLQNEGIRPETIYVNHVTVGRGYDFIDEINKRIKKISPRSYFDSLILRDVEDNSHYVKSFLDYGYKKQKNDINNLLKEIFQTKVKKRLEKTFKHNWCAKELDEEIQILDEMRWHSLSIEDLKDHPLFEEVAKKELLRILNDNVERAKEFYHKLGIPEEYLKGNFAYADKDFFFSYYDENSGMHRIDPREIIVSSKNGKLNFFDLSILPLTIHEMAHGIIQQVSHKYMPAGMERRFEPFIHGTVEEGKTLFLEEIWLDEFLKSKEDKKIKRIVELTERSYTSKKILQTLHDIYEIEDDDNESVDNDAHKRIAKLTGIHRFANRQEFSDRCLEETLQSLTYFIGEPRTQKLSRKICESSGISKREFVHYLFPGRWVKHETQKDFIEEVLMK